MSDKVIAVLMPKGKRRENARRGGVQALIRREDGDMVVQDVKDTGVFRFSLAPPPHDAGSAWQPDGQGRQSARVRTIGYDGRS